MPTKKFRASVQYGDWKGSAAADDADTEKAYHWLKEKKKIRPDEFIVGITLWAGENHGEHKDPVYVTFLLATPAKHDAVQDQIKAGSITVREVDVKIKVVDFFGLFKRFSIAISAHGMLQEQEYTSNETES